MLIILKIPVVYLCAVVWYAVKAEPDLESGGEDLAAQVAPRPWRPWHSWRPPLGPRPRRGGPHGSPTRAYARVARPAAAHAKVKR